MVRIDKDRIIRMNLKIESKSNDFWFILKYVEGKSSPDRLEFSSEMDRKLGSLLKKYFGNRIKTIHIELERIADEGKIINSMLNSEDELKEFLIKVLNSNGRN